jgi:hypothetical protein
MNFSSSFLNDILKNATTLNGRPIPGRPTNEVIETPTPAVMERAMNTQLGRKRKEMREAKRAVSDDIKKLLEKDPLTKKDVEMYFLNKLLGLITAEED